MGVNKITVAEDTLDALIQNPDRFLRGLTVTDLRETEENTIKLSYSRNSKGTPRQIGIVKSHFIQNYYTFELDDSEEGMKLYHLLRR